MSGAHDLTELPAQRGQIWRRAVLLSLLCAVLAYLASSDLLHEALMNVLRSSQSVITHDPILGPALFVLAAALSAMFAFVSVAVIVPVAVFVWGEPLSILLLWCGWLLGGVLAYGTGRWLGRPVVRWLTVSAGLERLERLIRPDTPFVLVLLFQLALPSEIPGYVLGLARYSPGKYFVSLALAELPFALATVHLGASFMQRQGGVVLLIGLGLALFSVLMFHVLRQQLKGRN
jgi:uncharacterized membrane protein YdjX (TVP38/TMEM64 family)